MGRVGQQKEEHFGRSDHEVVRKGELSCFSLKKISSGMGGDNSRVKGPAAQEEAWSLDL